MCLCWDLEVGLSFVVVMPFASWSAILFPIILVCILTFNIVILWVNHIIWLTIADMSNLSGWSC